MILSTMLEMVYLNTYTHAEGKWKSINFCESIIKTFNHTKSWCEYNTRLNAYRILAHGIPNGSQTIKYFIFLLAK